MLRIAFLVLLSLAALTGCKTTGSSSSISSSSDVAKTASTVELRTCAKPFAEKLDLRLRLDWLQREMLLSYKIAAPEVHLETLARSSGCFDLVRSADPGTVKAEFVIDMTKETPALGPVGVLSLIAAPFVPLGGVEVFLAAAVGGMVAAAEFAEIQVAVKQEVVLPGGSYHSLSTVLPAVHGRSGYILPRGASLGDLQSTPEGRQFVLGVTMALNQLIGEFEGGRVAALRPKVEPAKLAASKKPRASAQSPLEPVKKTPVKKKTE